MSWLGRLRNLAVNDEKAWNPSLWRMFGSQSLSGEVVTEDTALTYSAVFNAIELISGTIASLPLNLMQTKDRGKRIADNLRLHRVMHSQWNRYMTAKRGRQTMIAHCLAWGNGYAEIVRDGYNNVVQLWPISPRRVTPKLDEDGDLVYEIKLNRGTVTLPWEQVLHINGPSDDGFVGISRIGLARKSIGLGMAIETFGAKYFGNGTHPGIIVKHEGKLSEQTHKNLQNSLSDTYSGLGQSHRLMLLEDGMSIEKIGIPPDDSQFLESRQHHISEVARWFNLPPHKLKDLTRSSFSNIESEQRSFYTDSLLPNLVDLEQSYDMQLLTETERNNSGRGRLYFKHNAEGILRADSAARGALYKDLWNVGAMSINEIREKEDMDPIEGGDEYFVPLNMIPLSKIDEYLAKQSTPPKSKEVNPK